MANADTTKSDQPGWVCFAAVLLIILGIVLATVALLLWRSNDGGTLTTMTVVTKKAVPGSAQQRRSRARPRRETTTVTTTTLTGQPGDRSKASAPQAVSRRSESLTIAMLGLGTLAVLAGAFFTRLSGITLPGGAGIQLRTQELKEETAKTLRAVTKALRIERRARLALKARVDRLERDR
jgi:hypothetical protein